MLSPTRTYLPVVKKIMEEWKGEVLGLVHCSGGGQTKCMRFGAGVHHLKDNLFAPPPLFREIQRVSGTTDEEMHQVYNMGHRLEAYCKPQVAEDLIGLAGQFGIDARIIGRTESSERKDGANHLTLRLPNKTLSYG